jgi:aspartate carbamoyltransferase catalytic subunit
MLRVQRERQRQQFFPSVREYARLFGLSPARVDALPDSAVIMHPGPMNRGVEIAADVADLSRALITDQVTNGIAVRMSLLYLMLGGDARRGSEEEGSAAVPEELQGAAGA